MEVFSPKGRIRRRGRGSMRWWEGMRKGRRNKEKERRRKKRGKRWQKKFSRGLKN